MGGQPAGGEGGADPAQRLVWAPGRRAGGTPNPAARRRHTGTGGAGTGGTNPAERTPAETNTGGREGGPRGGAGSGGRERRRRGGDGRNCGAGGAASCTEAGAAHHWHRGQTRAGRWAHPRRGAQACIAVTARAQGTRNCDGQATNSCEVNLNLTTSCGTSCDNAQVCPGAQPTCVVGECGAVIGPTACSGTITPGNVTITNAASLTAFQAAGTTCIQGTLTINGASVTNLAGLEALQWVGGGVTISNNTTLTNLTGLSGLTTVVGGLNLSGNSALNNVSGLGALRTVGDFLQIQQRAL